MASRRLDLPIFQDDLSFQDRHEGRFSDLQSQLRHDLDKAGFGAGFKKWNWGDDLDQLCGDFLQLKPRNPRQRDLTTRDDFGSRESLDEQKVKNMVYENPATKSRVFQLSFNVKDYEPEDIAVKVEGDTLVVTARHEDVTANGGKSVREFSRKAQIPHDVDSDKLASTLSTDGILSIEAPVPPKYESVAYTSQDSNGSQSSSGASGYASQPLHSAMSQGTPAVPRGTTATSVPLDTPTFISTPSGRVMDLVLDIGKPYTPDDLVVKLEEKVLTIEAEHVEKGAGKSGKCSMSRCFDIQEDIDPSTIEAMLRTDGKLCITAKAVK